MSNLKEEISDLYKLKNDYKNKISLIEKKIDKLQNQIYKECEIKNNGHKWITEKEIGPYGITFHYCEYCNYER